MELLVSLGLFAVIGGIVSQTFVAQSDIYLADIGRARVQQNLRGALDIIATNVRQAGEGLDRLFPALTLTSDNVLTTRRKLITEELTPCRVVTSGVTYIYVSDVAATTTECLAANVTPSLAKWSAARVASGGTLRVYLYDRVSKVGEFVSYTGEGSSEFGAFITVSAPFFEYPVSATSMFVLEEYVFSRDGETNTVLVKKDGWNETPEEVAYDITNFDVRLRMKDGTIINSLSAADVQTWKDIQLVSVALSGQEAWRSKTVNLSVSGDYFPRNVLSTTK